jgi:hypothetical protein
MNKNQKLEENRNPDGTFANGNAFGRIPKEGLTILDLTKLVRKYEKTQDKTILKHYFERLFENDRLLSNFIDRYVPRKQLNELTGPDGQPVGGTQITLIEKVYEDCPLKHTGECPVREKVKLVDGVRSETINGE